MTPTDKDRLELIEAVEALGGPLHASELTGTPRSTIIHWMQKGFPYYRQNEVDQIIERARRAELETLERLMRKHRPKAAK